LAQIIDQALKWSESIAHYICMNILKDIEHAVKQLSSDDLAVFRAWFAEFDAEIWDRQFEEDVAAGRLDTLAKKALRHLREGRCTNL
jgi:hypothetical protein